MQLGAVQKSHWVLLQGTQFAAPVPLSSKYDWPCLGLYHTGEKTFVQSGAVQKSHWVLLQGTQFAAPVLLIE